MRVLPDGTYLTVLISPPIRGRRRERLLAAARAGQDLTDINTVPDAFDERGLPVVHLARVIEYDVPDRAGNGTGELVVLLTTITDPAGKRPRRRAGRRLPPAMGAGDRQRPAQDPPARPGEGTALTAARPGPPGDLGLPDRPPRDQRADRPSLRRRRPRPGPALLRQGPAPDPPYRHRDGGHSPLRTGLTALPAHLAEIATLLIPPRRERTCPRAVKRARHNSYRVKKPGEPASIRHRAPATINIRALKPRSAA